MLLKIDSSSELSICRGVVDWGGLGLSYSAVHRRKHADEGYETLFA